MQQDWVRHKHKLAFPDAGHEQSHSISRLDMDELDSIVPGAKRFLKLSARRATPLEETETIPPPKYNWELPASNFWESYDGTSICSAGCVPLTASPTRQQYEAVVATQDHLRELSMLQVFTTVEIHKALRQLQQLRTTSKHKSLLLGVIQGLLEGAVVVYKGLATGFTVPYNGTEFWGVSNYRVTEGVVDIFISRNCPNDVSTIFHTWLAHHNVPREERYEEELLLEGGESGETRLPRSIQTAVTSSTPSEVLSLLRRLQSTTTRHPFIMSIRNFCSSVLLHETDLEAMNQETSSGFLSGSVSIKDLLAGRLSRYAVQGAGALPSVNNLTNLYYAIEAIIDDALLQGDRETLARLTLAVSNGYRSGTTEVRYIDIDTDLVMLMFFCALRKAALEDVYMEATDHCPMFSQPDQAAVFSELWVLGSQCEQYFRMKPRALGKIIYDRNREFLKGLPPAVLTNAPGHTPKSWGLMSMYAKPEPAKTGGMDTANEGTSTSRLRRVVKSFSASILGFGALSIFCLPAVVDLVLLTFLGRGLFMTAYMGEEQLTACCYGLLVSLLISAGVTGWVGSVGNYYLFNVCSTFS